MADSYHIIDGKVIPYSGGRKCNDTDAWRDATPLELQLQEQLEECEYTIAAQESEVEALRAEVAAWRELSDHVRVGACAAIWPDRYTDARTRDVAAALKRAARMEEEVERLRADRDSWEQQASDRVADWHAEHLRAERLAEALRDAREFVAEALSDERAKFAGYEAVSDIAGIEATLQKIDAALAQEDRNG